MLGRAGFARVVNAPLAPTSAAGCSWILLEAGPNLERGAVVTLDGSEVGRLRFGLKFYPDFQAVRIKLIRDEDSAAYLGVSNSMGVRSRYFPVGKRSTGSPRRSGKRGASFPAWAPGAVAPLR